MKTEEEKLKEILGDDMLTKDEQAELGNEGVLKWLDEQYKDSPGRSWGTSQASCPTCGQRYVQGFCACQPGPPGTYYNPTPKR